MLPMTNLNYRRYMTFKFFPLLLFCTVTSFSQQKKATLYSKGSTELLGFAKINYYDDEIKFRHDKNSIDPVNKK